MKKIRMMIWVVLSVLAFEETARAQLATKISWFFFPCSLPNTTVPEFGTARDNLLTGMCFGGALETHTRVWRPSGIELKRAFDSSDITVSETNNLWRGDFNPSYPYETQRGQRLYCPVVIVGLDGKISLDRLRYRVTCGVALLGNQSSLVGLDYSVSRRGILSGSDGLLFTADDVFVTSGSGTNLVDGIAYIGARIGATAHSSSDFSFLDAEIGQYGTFVNYTYEFVNSTNVIRGSCVVSLYPRGMVPLDFDKLTVFPCPRGMLFSIVGRPGIVGPMTVETSRSVTGPWVLATQYATEGSSIFLPYLQGTKDYGFIKIPYPFN